MDLFARTHTFHQIIPESEELSHQSYFESVFKQEEDEKSSVNNVQSNNENVQILIEKGKNDTNNSGLQSKNSSSSSAAHQRPSNWSTHLERSLIIIRNYTEIKRKDNDGFLGMVEAPSNSVLYGGGPNNNYNNNLSENTSVTGLQTEAESQLGDLSQTEMSQKQFAEPISVLEAMLHRLDASGLHVIGQKCVFQNEKDLSDFHNHID